MSEEKLYVVKNDEGQYWEFGRKRNSFLDLSDVDLPVTIDKDLAFEVARNSGGHVVTFVEEPEKVVLSKEQAEIVKNAQSNDYPATEISDRTDDSDGVEKLLMNAYVNGYTVAKEKRYLVGLDGLVTTGGAKQYLTKKDDKWFACRRIPGMHQDFTDEELNAAPEWAQQLNREEVTDDEQ
ncbi:DUF1642 domain-containing protein [Lacticaseibacillus paracasei]|uniref:Uncharacterized protein n=1 Tax=Lacticaseibacillus paracasei NRIC 0644 TaxID=1435038 RepID=A0A0C9PUG4_LACPA|nr:DUF1642 domain-containing protein [Lacticaseibacillus paracasei]GAN35654.1 uncharacterized protein LC0644_0243 [Lacticaseibacillus paracasei NRIC 0644]GAN38887.1 uncharacterized protein LC1917_0764 [Lacticaseibacillus paracasei NRIC 1917]